MRLVSNRSTQERASRALRVADDRRRRDVKALSRFMGHANIRITLDKHGDLLPGAEDEAAGLLDTFLARQLGGTAAPTAAHPAESRL